MLLGIIAKPLHRDKFEVTPDSVAYLTALVAVSEEVRSRCHVKHALPRWPADLSGNSIDNGELPNGVQTVSYKSYVAIIQYTIYLTYDVDWSAIVTSSEELGYFGPVSFAVCASS